MHSTETPAEPWQRQQEDRRQLLAQAREIRQRDAQIEALCAQHEAQLTALEARLRDSAMACAMAQDRLRQIEHSRGYRLLRLYAALFHLPVLGPVLWRLRKAAGRTARLAITGLRRE